MREWYFQAMGQELGPFSAVELKAKVENGQVQPDTMVRRGVDGKWLFADRVKGLLPERPAPAPPAPVPVAKPKSSQTMPIAKGYEDSDPPAKGQTPPRSNPVIAISLEADDGQDDATAPSSEFYDFVGFREAISPALHVAARRYLSENRLTMTQLNRRALAAFIAKPELGGDLMISNMAVLPQQVNDKSNSDGSHPLADQEKVEHATFRLTLFNCSTSALDVFEGEFIPETVEARDYDEVGTRVIPAMDHKGHFSIKLDGVQAGLAIPITLKSTVGPMSAATVTVWFRGTSKPSLLRVRGHLRLKSDGGGAAISESFNVTMHGDSQG